MTLDTIALAAAMVGYWIAGVSYAWALVRGPNVMVRKVSVIAIMAVVLHGVAIVARGLVERGFPFSSLAGSMILMAWALVVLYLVSGQSMDGIVLGAFVCLASAGLLAVALGLPMGTSLKVGFWGAVHICACLVGYAGFVLAFGSAVIYMLHERMLKLKCVNALQKRLPSLDAADGLAHRMASVGFLALTLGIAAGSVWASTAWGQFWQWDSKESWTLITWFIYAAYLHVRVIRGWHGKWANRLLIVGFACVFFTYFGAASVFQSLHRHGW